MIGFLFGLAAGLAIGCVLGALAAAVYEEKMGREVDRVFRDRDPIWGPAAQAFREGRLNTPPREGTIRPESTYTDERFAAGLTVCSCIGALRGPHFVDPECPFHGGAA